MHAVRREMRNDPVAQRDAMDAVIKAVQTKAASRADGKTISQLVGKLLP